MQFTFGLKFDSNSEVAYESYLYHFDYSRSIIHKYNGWKTVIVIDNEMSDDRTILLKFHDCLKNKEKC